MTCPCGICEERFVGCHAQCDAYKAWDAERWKKRDEYRQRNREDLLDDFKAGAMQKQRRRRR